MQRFFLGLPLLLLLASCTAPVASFDLQAEDETVALTEEPGRWKRDEGLVDASIDASYELRVADPEEALLPPGKYLEVRYSGDARGALVRPLYSRPSDPEDRGAAFPQGSAALFGAQEPLRFLVPLVDSASLRGVRITRSSAGEPFRIVGVSLVEPWQGVSLEEGELVVSGGTEVRRDLESRRWTIGLPEESDPRVPLVIEYAADPALFQEFDGEPVSALLALVGPEGNRRYLNLRLRPGDRRVQLYPWFLGFSPVELHFDSQGAPADLRGVGWGVPAVPGEATAAELSTVLAYQSENLSEDYTLFRWNLYPDILLMDFSTYQTQSDYLKRLAFFVEKRGYRGRVPSFQELAGRHGWNAHNYSPQGLASFFSAAADISPEEESLKNLALREGVITREDTSATEYQDGSGGVLSVSQESYPILRRLLLTHEAMHGIFYSEPAFVDATWRVWESQSEEFRNAWRFFLSSMTYDPEDEYLMVNEFQAYLLQQPLEDVEAYLNWRIVGRIRAGDPGGSRFSEAFLQSFVAESVIAAGEINEALFRTTGLLGGDVLCLIPAESQPELPIVPARAPS